MVDILLALNVLSGCTFILAAFLMLCTPRHRAYPRLTWSTLVVGFAYLGTWVLLLTNLSGGK